MTRVNTIVHTLNTSPSYLFLYFSSTLHLNLHLYFAFLNSAASFSRACLDNSMDMYIFGSILHVEEGLPGCVTVSYAITMLSSLTCTARNALLVFNCTAICESNTTIYDIPLPPTYQSSLTNPDLSTFLCLPSITVVLRLAI